MKGSVVVVIIVCTAAICTGLFFVWKSNEDQKRILVDAPKHKTMFVEHEYDASCDMGDQCTDRELTEIEKGIWSYEGMVKRGDKRFGPIYELEKNISGRLDALEKLARERGSDKCEDKIKVLKTKLDSAVRQAK